MRGRARLGLLAGAFFIAPPASAQVIQPPGSEVPIPPKPKTDSAPPKPDTIKARFSRSIDPRGTDIGPEYSWNREELFASGALTLADLLERVPGTTSFRSGWLASPKFVAINGDLNRVRIFYDGVEIDNLDARTAPLLDLTGIQIWTLEHVSIERVGGEMRVHLRSWQADRTSPYTRTDISTGDEDTNLYRGFYGKRFRNGGALQIAGQQFSTTSARFGGGGDGLSFVARTGVARANWSIDGFANRTFSTRVIQPTFGSGLSLPNFGATNTLAYLRGAFGKIGDGPWLELIAATRQLKESSTHVTESSAASLRVISDTTDTTSSLQQYILSAGFARGPLRVSATDRIRSYAGATTNSAGGRLDFDSPYGVVNVSAEHDAFASVNRADAAARVTPVPFFAVGGGISRVSSTLSGTAKPPDVMSARAEVGLRLFGPWLIGGFITRDTALLSPLAVFDTAYVSRFGGRANGAYVGLRGTIVGALGADIVATRWDSADFYRPRYQARSELNFVTRWLSRFPSGSFGFKAAMIHEYRGQVRFPTSDGDRLSTSVNDVSALFEIRILRGVISYQIRNIAGELHQIVPDFYMPRAISLYGIRWEFWN